MGFFKNVLRATPIGMGVKWIEKRNRRKDKKKAKVKADKEVKRKEEEAIRDQAFQNIENTPLPSREDTQELEGRSNEMADAEKERLKGNREANKEEAMEDVTTKVPGMDPRERQALQERANVQIGGHLDNYSRMMASSQGSKGIRGGKAQADLRRKALSAQNEASRDIMLEDVAQANRKLAAYLTSLEGKGAQDVLTKAQYRDLLQGQQDKKKESAYNQYFAKYFGKVKQ